MLWKRLYLQPLGSENTRLFESILTAVRRSFNISCVQLPPISLPESTYDSNRGQYCSPNILNALSRHLPYDAMRILGMTAADLYVPRYNYIFGQAMVDGSTALISTHRLRPEFYGFPADEQLVRERSSKEAIHEIGHTFGLHHCGDRICVMHFSTTIEDTDRKSTEFCSSCTDRLTMKLKQVKAA